MGLSEMKARFRGYRRREEEIEEARLVEHNRNVSELFTSMVFDHCSKDSCASEYENIRKAGERCCKCNCKSSEVALCLNDDP